MTEMRLISELENESLKAEAMNVFEHKENVLRAQQTYYADGGDQPPQLSEEHSTHLNSILLQA
jgi:hypothetical protein